MINRINLILQAKNITAKQFAEEIGIQPSGMSHILSGRNNPSLEFVNKVLRRYPEIDANWFVLGKGQMYASSAGAPRPMPESVGVVATPPTLFSEADDMASAEELKEDGLAEPREAELPKAAEEEVRYAPTYIASAPVPSGDQGRDVVRMILVYSDNTFSEYTPRR